MCRTEKHFMDLYHASLDKKEKYIESHIAVLEENNIEENNVIVVYNATPLINIKNLDVSNFFF